MRGENCTGRCVVVRQIVWLERHVRRGECAGRGNSRRSARPALGRFSLPARPQNAGPGAFDPQTKSLKPAAFIRVGKRIGEWRESILVGVTSPSLATHS